MGCHRGLCIWNFQRYNRPNHAHHHLHHQLLQFVCWLWIVYGISLQYSYKKSYRGVGDSCTHNCLSYMPSSSRIQIELASVYAMAPNKRFPLQWSQWQSCCYQLPSHSLWIKCWGIWIKGCILMSTLEVCSFGILSKCLWPAQENTVLGHLRTLLFFTPTSADGTHSWLHQIPNLVASYSTESQGMSSTRSESNRNPVFDVAIAFNWPMP